MRGTVWVCFVLGIGGLCPSSVSADVAIGAETSTGPTIHSEAEISTFCATYSNSAALARMDGLRRKIRHLCGPYSAAAQLQVEAAEGIPETMTARVAKSDKTLVSSIDTQVNDSSSDVGGFSHTQSETSVAVNELTGAICTGFNDSYHHFADGDGFVGFSRSVDGGSTFDDRGALGAGTWGDPSLVWRRSDESFYFLSLVNGGLGLWRSTNDCLAFQWLPNVSDSLGADRGMMTVDNHSSSPFYGRLYVVWTEFGLNGIIVASHSDDGITWSDPVELSESDENVQAAWPAVAPDGTLYVAWLRWPTSETVSIEAARSDNGGATFAAIADPMTGRANPEDSAASAICFQQALKGNIRHMPAPQLAVDASSTVHVVYSYDPDGVGTGDAVNVYYRRSSDRGASWHGEIQLNDDQTTNDQFFPSLSVGDGATVSVGWYDRRLDPANLMLDYYARFSHNGGTTWQQSIRLSDTSTPIALDPDLAVCYHGDYDQQVRLGSSTMTLWSDDRNVQDGHNDADVWLEKIFIDILFADGFESGSLSAWGP